MADAKVKIAKQRLSVMELAETLGSVSEACRRRGMPRSQFYEFKRRFQTHGFEGLKDLPPIPKSHPETTTPEEEAKILEVSGKHPAWGCDRLSAQLKLEGVSISGPTVQKILAKNGLGAKYERLLALEKRHLEDGIKLTADQVRAIEKANPCFRERHVESKKPGELLCQDTFYVGRLKGVGKVYMQAVIDTFGSYAFAYLHTGKVPEHAAFVLHDRVIPQYDEWEIKIGALLTDNGREYCGRDDHPFELFLELNDIEHRRTKVRSPRTNGFVERFNRTVLDEFFRTTFRENFYASVDALQKDLDKWLAFYNNERPHLGYRNMGKRPIDTIKKHANIVRKDS